MKYIDTIYGEFELSGLVEELIHTTVFQRLKKVHQGGAIFLANPQMNLTRFEHSVGVMLLTKKLGGSIEAQIAGLLHDISHTAFSHLIDYVLDVGEEDYHEKRYTEVLNNPEIINVFEKYHLSISQFLNLEKYPLIEYPLPNLSADRIDYALRDLHQLKRISKEEIDWFLEGLLVYENRIVASSKEHGSWFKSQYSFLVSEYFNGIENVEINSIMKIIVKDCLQKGIITEADFFMDDFYLLEKMNSAFNVGERIDRIKNNGLNTEKIKMKSRVVDPEVLVNKRVMKLSELS